MVDGDALAVGAGKRSEDLVGDRLGPDEEKVELRVGTAGAQSAVNHDGGSMVPAEEVDGDPRDAGA